MFNGPVKKLGSSQLQVDKGLHLSYPESYMLKDKIIIILVLLLFSLFKSKYLNSVC